MNYKKVLKKLAAAGWEIQPGGRHVKVNKDGKRVPVPIHGKKDIKLGTLKSIEKLTGVNLTKTEK